MVDSDLSDWDEESIPESAQLYYRVHVSFIREGKLHPGVFREKGGSISTDWDRYSTPEESRRRARVPEENGIIALGAGRVRAIDELSIRHSPDRTTPNRAHTDILGLPPDDAATRIARNRVRTRLLRACDDRWLIDPFLAN